MELHFPDNARINTYDFKESIFVSNIFFSFVVGIGFGKMIGWPRCVAGTSAKYNGVKCTVFCIGIFWLSGFGIALANRCMLPIIPMDTFPRDMSEILNKPYKYVKTTFDLCCLTTTLVLSIGILHGLHGVGIGTVLCAFITGKTVSMFPESVRWPCYILSRGNSSEKPEISGRTV